jgi:predicted PurR-regulated permease PerM
MIRRVSDYGPSTRAVFRVVLIVVLSGLALYLVWVLRKPITWIVIAGFIAIAVSAPIRFLEGRSGRRGLATAMVFIGLILLPVAIGAVLVPPVVTEAQNLADKVPDYAKDLRKFAQDNSQLRKLEEDYDITGKLEEEAAKLPGKLGGAAGLLSDIGLGIVNSLFAGITILILSVFMVSGGDRWVEAAIRSRPEEHQDMLRRLVRDIAKAVGGYCAGALGQATVAGVASFIVLSILGVPYAAALSLIIFLLDLVPLVGATLGAIIVGLVTLFNDFPTDTIIWIVWSVAYQQIENSVIQPRIQAATVNVQPIVILIAVLFGSTLFGVLGALLAIPFAAAIQISLREYRHYRRLTRIQPPPPGTAAPPEPSPA